ncbi:unnamed protein product [Caenorhabditis brenneri]
MVLKFNTPFPKRRKPNSAKHTEQSTHTGSCPLEEKPALFENGGPNEEMEGPKNAKDSASTSGGPAEAVPKKAKDSASTSAVKPTKKTDTSTKARGKGKP